MALINLLPNADRKARSTDPAGAAFQRTKELSSHFINALSLSKPILLTLASFLAILAILFISVKSKERIVVSLEKTNLNIKKDYLKLEALTKQKNELSETFSNLRALSRGNFSWVEKLTAITAALPRQVWLRQLAVEFAQNKDTSQKPVKIKTLSIKGSAYSSVDTQALMSITEFIDTLKKDRLFSKDFHDIKLGPLESEKKNNLAVMNFTIFCTYNKNDEKT
jgi:Tfp pilus assembly protein PilN